MTDFDPEILVVDISCPGTGDRVCIHLSHEVPVPIPGGGWDHHFQQAFQRFHPAFTAEVRQETIWLQASLEDVQNYELVTRVREAVAAANAAWNEHVAEQHRRQREKEQAEAEVQRYRDDQLAQIKRDQLHS